MILNIFIQVRSYSHEFISYNSYESAISLSYKKQENNEI